MKYWNALNLISGVGSQKLRMLFNFFENGAAAWEANTASLQQSGIGEDLAQKICTERNGIDPDNAWQELEGENIEVIGYFSVKYPKLLKEIPNPPFLLYTKGSYLDFNHQPMIAVVGSRKFTAYGKQVAYSLAQDLARSGVTVVSGMALGIDAMAHRGALSVHGKTFAVLGSGLEDRAIGPRLNFQLSREIMDHGALISEFPIGTKITPGNFPARNRIMAGLTMGTLVIEAAEDSGSLITANLACEFNREVFSIPGSIFSQASAGTNRLIQTGSKLVTGVADILTELRIEQLSQPKDKSMTTSLSDTEQKILNLLSSEPVHVDKLIKAATLKTSEISALLSMMEIKGLIKNIGSQNYIIT